MKHETCRSCSFEINEGMKKNMLMNTILIYFISDSYK